MVITPAAPEMTNGAGVDCANGSPLPANVLMGTPDFLNALYSIQFDEGDIASAGVETPPPLLQAAMSTGSLPSDE